MHITSYKYKLQPPTNSKVYCKPLEIMNAAERAINRHQKIGQKNERTQQKTPMTKNLRLQCDQMKPKEWNWEKLLWFKRFWSFFFAVAHFNHSIRCFHVECVFKRSFCHCNLMECLFQQPFFSVSVFIPPALVETSSTSIPLMSLHGQNKSVFVSIIENGQVKGTLYENPMRSL